MASLGEFYLILLPLALHRRVFLYTALTPAFGLPTLLPWGIGVEGTVSRFIPITRIWRYSFLPLLVWQQLWTVRSTTVLGTGKLLKYTLLYGGAAGMIASFFALAEPTAVYLSPGQLVNLLMLIIGMNLPILSHTTGRRELMDMSQNDSKTQIQQEQQNQERAKTLPVKRAMSIKNWTVPTAHPHESGSEEVEQSAQEQSELDPYEIDFLPQFEQGRGPRVSICE